ncbi:SlyX family protein [Aeoliella mucimassa]|uniref:Protein SlyX n=1 Tax=Aeoliella mucimassa TaxID=2527972 RepID=A0A518AT33_9BACT|nr:SlyX family protein [Aeoliella mucimassa]QDU57878.1 hypothetical protein Pan181_41010 [Aeoliella mucimassa]
MAEDRQTQLEELLAHQQHLIDTLNSVVTSQQSDINTLQQKTDRLEAKVKLLAEYMERVGEDLPHEKPPHY